MRIATFNLKHGAASDGYRGHPAAVAEACATLNADILALQEVDRGVIRSRFANLAALAAEASDMNYVFAPTLHYRVGSYGNALLVRGEIDEFEVLQIGGGHRFKIGPRGHQLPLVREPRNAIVAQTDIGGRKITVAATHLATEPAVRKHQLPKIVSYLAARPEPQVLMGDFNQGRGLVAQELSDHPYELAEDMPTFPLPHPRKMIDHIAVSGLAIRSAWTQEFDISDHAALIAEVDSI